MLTKNKKYFVDALLMLAVLTWVLFQSCNLDKDLDKLVKPDYEPTFAIPLLKAQLVIEDIIRKFEQGDFFREDSTKFLTLVYRGDLFSISAGDLFALSNQTFSSDITLANLQVNDFQGTGEITLLQIVDNIANGDSIKSKDGQTSPFPPIPEQSAGTITFPTSSQFSSVVLQSGLLIADVTNNLPVEVSKLSMGLSNKISGSAIGNFSFTSILPGQVQSDTIDLAGKTLEDSIIVSIDTISSPGSVTPVLIDLTDELTISMNGKNLIVQSGTAIIPDQALTGVVPNFDYNFGTGVEMNSMTLKEGDIKYTINSDIKENIQLTVNFPTIKINGRSINKKILIPYTGTTPVILTGDLVSEGLTGYKIDFTNGGTDTNTIPLNYTAQIISSGQPRSFSSTDKFSILVAMNNIKFSFADGYFGQQVFDLGSDTVKISLYDNYTKGKIDFVNPTIKLLINSSYGFPTRAAWGILQARQIESGQTIDITGFPNPTDFSYPQFSQLGKSVTTEILLSKTTSNVMDVISLPPNQLIYSIIGTSNVNGKLNPTQYPTQENFVTDSSRFDVAVEVEFPLHGSIKDLTIENIYDFNLDIESVEEVISALFKINIENEFPLDGRLQIYFTDSNLVILDSLIATNEKFIKSAEVDADGIVTKPTLAYSQTLYTFERFKTISEKAHKMLVRATVNSTNDGNTNVRIYSNYILDVKVGVKTQLSF